MTSSKYLVGAVIGGAIGAAFGLLFAPRSGAETREIIRDEVESRSREAAEALKEKSAVIQEKAAGLKEKIVDLTAELEEKGKATVARFKEGNNKSPEATS